MRARAVRRLLRRLEQGEEGGAEGGGDGVEAKGGAQLGADGVWGVGVRRSCARRVEGVEGVDSREVVFCDGSDKELALFLSEVDINV